ncbi:putative leucine-rich repeat domain, L domain-containing protein [Rosa chinensis]|uniref:Putative leucine-rich repeat domain, L domain-containing protein n=1 Tax=Rosa chinensis TaxID=74649 RepID=A0A2P6PM04_ROSCH|nr:putative leucine-rich repeat domain, L domain-containing protein [Rosa chinensis]
MGQFHPKCSSWKLMYSSSTTTISLSRFLMLLAPHQHIISLLPTTSSGVQSQIALAKHQKRFMRSSSSTTNSQSSDMIRRCLPWEIGKLNQATLFDVSTNYLTGPIPHSFACLAKMEILVLANNQFYGTVPELVCKLPGLRNLSLANNYFTQVGPECRKLIKKGFLDVKNNCILDLPDQRSKSECGWFFSKARHCPNERSMLYIPCQTHYSNEKKPEHRGQASAPLSYGTLKPHNP